MDVKSKLYQIRDRFIRLWNKGRETLRIHLQSRPWYVHLYQKLGILIGAGFLSIALLYLLIWTESLGHLPDHSELNDIQNNTSTEIYTSDGVLLGKYFIENRKNISIDSVSTHLINALVTVEDKRFFEHNGIDLRAWMRVLFKTVLFGDRSSGGGSTLTQQLAKNLYPRQSYRFLSLPINKIREAIVARRLERIYSKHEIIGLYLNTVPFTGTVYGVEVAARQFFNSDSKNISLENAAVLIGMLKGISIYNPIRHRDRAQARRNTVLKLMEQEGLIEPMVYDSLSALSLEINYTIESHNEGLGTYYRSFLKQELEEELQGFRKPDGSIYNIYRDGLRIYTTIDSRMQRYAEEAVAEHLSGLQKTFDEHWKERELLNLEMLNRLKQQTKRYQNLKKEGLSEAEIDTIFSKPIPMKVFSWEGEIEKNWSPFDSLRYYFQMLHAGFMVMDPQNGHLKAWVGGIDHKYFQYDHVLSSRQVGSTFKPLVYANALRNGMEPCDFVNNRLVIYSDYEDWKPQNADGKYGGAYSLVGALSQSVNVVTVDLIMQTKLDSVISLANQMGITTEIPEVPAIALGAVDISLKDMVSVYGTFANGGKRAAKKHILRIETADGEVLIDYEEKKPMQQVLDKETAQVMTKMLQMVVDSGTARSLRYRYGHYGPIAGKTGTTQSHADGWFIGYTPELVAGAWVGGDYPQVRFRSLKLGQGANTALPIWGLFFQKLYKDPAFKKWKYRQFPPLEDSLLAKIECPIFLEEEPEDSGFEIRLKNIFDFLKGTSNKNKEEAYRMNRKPAVKDYYLDEKKRKEEERSIKKELRKLKRDLRKRKEEVTKEEINKLLDEIDQLKKMLEEYNN